MEMDMWQPIVLARCVSVRVILLYQLQ